MSAAVYRPTHAVPANGLLTWATPDATQPSNGRLDPWLEVQVVQWWGNWANVQCANSWMAWVDGTALQPIGAPPPPRPMGAPAGAPASRNAMAAELVGAGIVALGTFFPWLSVVGFDVNAFKIPVDFLWSIDAVTKTDADAVSVGGLLVVLALGIAALAVAQQRSLARVAGGVAGAVCVVYALELVRSLNDSPDSPGLFSVLGYGAYVSLVGAVIALAVGGPARR